MHKINQYCHSNSAALLMDADRFFQGLIFHANWSHWGWMTVALGHVVDENQRFWLEGWRCYCIEGRNAAGGTKKASKTELPAPGLYNVISLCRLQFQREISKGVTAATAGGCRSSKKHIRHSVFSVSTPAITRDLQSWIIHCYNPTVVSVSTIVNVGFKSEQIHHRADDESFYEFNSR